LADGKTWVVLDQRRDEPEWKPDGETREYTFENTRAYPLHRFVFEKTHNDINLYLAEIGLPDLNLKQSPYENYRRELNIEDAVHHLTYRQNGTTYRREYFANHPDNVLVFRFTADRKAAYTGRIDLRCAHGSESVVEGRIISFSGITEGATPLFNRNFEARMQVLHQGGAARAEGNTLVLDKRVQCGQSAGAVERQQQAAVGFGLPPGREHPDELLVRRCRQPLGVCLAAHRVA